MTITRLTIAYSYFKHVKWSQSVRSWIIGDVFIENYQTSTNDLDDKKKHKLPKQIQNKTPETER